MPQPEVQTVSNTELQVVVEFDRNIVLTDDPSAGFELTVNGQAHRIVDSSHDGGTIVLTVDPVFQGDDLVVLFENDPAYVFDAATGLEEALDFNGSSTNGSLIRREVEASNSAVYVPEPEFSDGEVTAQLEIELGRSDRKLISKFGPIHVLTTYVHDNDVAVSSPTDSFKNGTIIRATVQAPAGSEADVLAAAIEWQRRVRDNVIAALINKREMNAALPAADGELFEL